MGTAHLTVQLKIGSIGTSIMWLLSLLTVVSSKLQTDSVHIKFDAFSMMYIRIFKTKRFFYV